MSLIIYMSEHLVYFLLEHHNNSPLLREPQVTAFMWVILQYSLILSDHIWVRIELATLVFTDVDDSVMLPVQTSSEMGTLYIKLQNSNLSCCIHSALTKMS